MFACKANGVAAGPRPREMEPAAGLEPTSPFTAYSFGGRADMRAKLGVPARLELAFPLTIAGLGNQIDTGPKWNTRGGSNSHVQLRLRV